MVCVWPGLKKGGSFGGLARRFTGVSGCSPGVLGDFWVSAGGFGLGFRRFLLVVDGVLWLEIKMELGCGCFRSTGSNKKEGKEAWVFGSGFCIAAASPDFQVMAAGKLMNSEPFMNKNLKISNLI